MKIVPIKRVWSMPNKSTFKIRPIKELLKKYVPQDGVGWMDPFSGTSKLCQFRNDINPAKQSAQSFEASLYIKSFERESLKGVILDPPYSLNQMKTIYNDFAHGKGLYCVRPDSMIYWSRFKNVIADTIKPGGLCICFGWNSMGLGKNRGFEQLEILLVPHGGSRNDTIVTVEQKLL